MEKTTYSDKDILIVGLGLSGRSAAYFLLKAGARVFGIDRNSGQLEHLPEIVSLKLQGLRIIEEESSYSRNFDLLIMSPGVPPTHPIYESMNRLNIPFIGEIELGLRSVTHPILGITGTNGKTTVTLLVTHVLNQTGRKARALGNIGIPFVQELDRLSSDEIIVLELSSYELETLETPAIDFGVILNITPDHLDRYDSMESYARAKIRLGKCVKESGSLFIEESAFLQFGHLSESRNYKLFGYSPRCHIYADSEYIYLNGKEKFCLPNAYRGFKNHDVENIMAAFALCHEMGVSSADFLSALKTFKKPPHRIEFVMEKNGVFYYDDSKGTNVDAVIRAVQSLKGPIVLIAGGVDKGGSYIPWLQGFANKVKCVCAIGHAACKIEAELSHHFPVEIFNDMDSAVRKAASLAEPGDRVLLSPGCSSFDMFRDYMHRGEEFKRIVRQL